MAKTSENKAWDEWKDSLITHENRLVHIKEKTVSYTVNYTFEEFKHVALEKSPVFIYCPEWSTEEPHFHITSRFMPSGVTFFCAAWADKTPVHYTLEKFYDMLQQPGLEYFEF